MDLEGITDAGHLIDWIYHLQEKEWFTPEMERQFLIQVKRAVGTDPRGVFTGGKAVTWPRTITKNN